MYLESDLKKEVYKTGEVAEILGLSNKTVQTYDKKGILPFKRTAKNRRVMEKRDLIEYLEKHHLLFRDNAEKRDVVYARVSSQKQKISGDLDRQALYIIEQIPDLKNPLVMKEVGSGLNDNRKQIQKLLILVMENQVSRIFVTDKDRLTRFGFHYLETVCSAKGVEIVVVKDFHAEKSVQEELTEDMMSLLASFSGKLYGLRSKGNSSKKRSESHE